MAFGYGALVEPLVGWDRELGLEEVLGDAVEGELAQGRVLDFLDELGGGNDAEVVAGGRDLEGFAVCCEVGVVDDARAPDEVP